MGTDEDIAGYACEPPIVLVLKVGSVTPAEDFQSYEIFPGMDIAGNVKTGFQFAVFAIAHFPAIHPDPYIGSC